MTNTFLQTALLRAKSRKNKKQNGFTLIELMIVVAIIGVLSAVGLPELSKAQDKAKIAAADAALSNAAKECSIALIIGEEAGYDGTKYTPAVTGSCEVASDGDVADFSVTATDTSTTSRKIVWEGNIPGAPEAGA